MNNMLTLFFRRIGNKMGRYPFSRFSIFLHMHRIFKIILGDPLNKNSKFELLINYLKWYGYQKPMKHVTYVTLQNGMKSIVHPDSDSGVSNIFTKNVDYFENVFVRRNLEADDFICDAGCNVGNRTLVLADIIGGALLIDANSRCLGRITKNFALNRIPMDNIHIRVNAVGSKKESVFFSDMGGTSCQNRIVTSDVKDKLCRKVEMTTVDDEMAELWNPPCAYIKFDLEGYDLQGLYGARKTLANSAMKFVKFERWPDVDIEPFRVFFDSIGWVIFAIGTDGWPSFDDELINSSNNLFAAPGKRMAEFR